MDEKDDKTGQAQPDQPLLLPETTKHNFVKQLFQKKWARITAVAIVAVPLVGLLAWWGWSKSSLSKLSVDVALVEGAAQYRLSTDDAWC